MSRGHRFFRKKKGGGTDFHIDNSVKNQVDIGLRFTGGTLYKPSFILLRIFVALLVISGRHTGLALP